MGHCRIDPYVIEFFCGFSIDIRDEKGVVIKFFLTSIKFDLSDVDFYVDMCT